MFVEWSSRGKPTVLGICSGAVAGLVAITPASGFVGPIGALAIGIAAGVVCYWAVTGLKHMLGYDDALDAFGVHGVGGIVGALLTGVFAIEQSAAPPACSRATRCRWSIRCIGVAIVLVYDAIVSLIILKIIDVVIGLRVTAGDRARRPRSRAAWRDGAVSDRYPSGRGGNPALSLPLRPRFARTGASLF